jgi:hypothetical protein
MVIIKMVVSVGLEDICHSIGEYNVEGGFWWWCNVASLGSHFTLKCRKITAKEQFIPFNT